MFNKKQTNLFPSKGDNKTKNKFLAEGMKKSAEVLSENGALKYSTTNNSFVDQFGLIGQYKAPRDFSLIEKDCSTLWEINPLLSVCFILYLRIITRVVYLFDGEKTESVQRGAGLKHEPIMRMMWLAVWHQDTFWKNIHLFIAVGSWKDIIQMLSFDLQYNGWEHRMLDWNKFGKLILAGLENPKTSELVKKYLPTIKTKNQKGKDRSLSAQADILIGKWICSLLFGSKKDSYVNYRQYRKLKSSGKAHQWQQLISKGKHILIDFNTIHGRALAQLVSSKYIYNHGLEDRYEKWISSRPIAKFTGYPHELFVNIEKKSKKYQIDTLDKQFMSLVETAKKDISQNSSLIVVRDTSGSMRSFATGTTQSCFDIAKALALFFSYMLPEGHFSNTFVEFNNSAKMHTWKGSTPSEKWKNDYCNCFGSTNFQAVIDLFCNIKAKGVNENEFPTGILCISDMEFNPSQLNETNVQTALKKLSKQFSKDYVDNFKIVLWNLQRDGGGNKFETADSTVKNVFYFSGYDGSVVSFLTGMERQEQATPKNAEELFLAAMDQEILKMVEI